MKRIVLGMLAHVDAGKTTLSEALLYKSGTIKQAGRVDKGDAFLDTEEQERERGITIFSKQAIIQKDDMMLTLLDTPGHVDFSAEMERALGVMDYAVLVISGPDGVQGHTKTLWKLLEHYEIPVFLFVNKMDQAGTDSDEIMELLHKELGDSCIDFSKYGTDDFYESVAVTDETLLEKYLEGATVELEDMIQCVQARRMFPCFFGSALKMTGVDEFLDWINKLTHDAFVTHELGGRVYKIARDLQGNRLSFVRITGGSLKVKDFVGSEKVNQIRLYSGSKYEAISEAFPGMIVALLGLNETEKGQGIGGENQAPLPSLEPVLTYEIVLPEDQDPLLMLPKLMQLEEELPEISLEWQEEHGIILAKLMGEVQIEVLQKIILDRFDVQVSFGVGKIVYKETIRNTVEGVGHFEPLRHYAEVHLLLEPGEPGSGMQFDLNCSEDLLNKNWQRLILTHLEERNHKGVLTGSDITDMKITVVSGRAHTKHTEGGDFRQATYRAVRQGLMQAENVLLEPVYDFVLELPKELIGRGMTDIEQMHGKSNPPEITENMAVLTGIVPVATARNYQTVVRGYSAGRGNFLCTLGGYQPCHNTEEVICQIGYHPDLDAANPSASVFCAHGAGFLVSWDEVFGHMHMDSVLKPSAPTLEEEAMSVIQQRKQDIQSQFLDEEEIMSILKQNSHANENGKKQVYKKRKPIVDRSYKGKERPQNQKRYMIVDGYNICHAWEDLKILLEDNIDGARQKLLDILSNYQGYIGCEMIVVFDGYKVKGNLGELYDYQNVHVVYTKEAETADSYIEKLTHDITKEYYVTVATSDGLVQLITRGQNCQVMSAKELKSEIDRVNQEIRDYLSDSK